MFPVAPSPPLKISELIFVTDHLSPILSLSSSAYNMPSFEAGAQLLSSLSGYAYTKRTWKKEVFELFMDPLFFSMDASCASKFVYLLNPKKLDTMHRIHL